MPTIANTTEALTTIPGATPKTSPGTNLGKDDFLKLLVGQLKNQNPMEPSSDTDFIAQMAQFSQLEQTTNMAKVNTELVAQQSGARAVALLGRTVTYPGADGVPTAGVVEKVEWSAGIPSLTVGGLAGVDPNSVTAVQ